MELGSSPPGGPTPDSRMVAGIMSGTSLDGVDVALVRVDGIHPQDLRVEVSAFRSYLHPEWLRERMRQAMQGAGARELALLHRELGHSFARALKGLLEEEGIASTAVAAVGSHGQTFWHEPPATTLQLGCGHTVAEATGIPVVTDFRSRDLAAGGQGAPLVPWPDWILFRRPGRGRALQNLGGMGNVTYLPSHGGPESVLAFDTGPGVALLDGVARRASDGRDAWDVDGRRAAAGRERGDLLEELLSDPFFSIPPPRSTGREHFGDGYLDALIQRVRPDQEGEQGWNDLLATLTALTAESVSRAYRDFLPWDDIHEVILTGGGARNPALVRRLETALAPIPVRTGLKALSDGGPAVDPDSREAVAFALLAWAHLQGVPANLPQVTGAEGPRVLGSLIPGRTPGRTPLGGRSASEPPLPLPGGLVPGRIPPAPSLPLPGGLVPGRIPPAPPLPLPDGSVPSRIRPTPPADPAPADPAPADPAPPTQEEA